MIQEDRKNIDPEQVRKLAGWGPGLPLVTGGQGGPRFPGFGVGRGFAIWGPFPVQAPVKAPESCTSPTRTLRCTLPLQLSMAGVALLALVALFLPTATFDHFSGRYTPIRPTNHAASGRGHPLSGTRETWSAPNVHLATVLPQLATHNYFLRPFPAGYCHPPTAGLGKDRTPPDLDDRPLSSMSPNRAIRWDKSLSSQFN